jgi:hypothetical protein
LSRASDLQRTFCFLINQHEAEQQPREGEMKSTKTRRTTKAKGAKKKNKLGKKTKIKAFGKTRKAKA